jgi:murein DD-endopeptidase MepM/ murein hydrolase activator NlpD
MDSKYKVIFEGLEDDSIQEIVNIIRLNKVKTRTRSSEDKTEEPVVVTLKQTYTSISNTLTDIENEFNKVLTYTSNFIKIQDAKRTSFESARKEAYMEQNTGGSAESNSGLTSFSFAEFTENLNALTEKTNTLAEKLGQLDLSGGGDGGPDITDLVDLAAGEVLSAGALTAAVFAGLATLTTVAMVYGLDSFMKSTQGEEQQQANGLKRYGMEPIYNEQGFTAGWKIDGKNYSNADINKAQEGDPLFYYKMVRDAYGPNNRGGASDKAREWLKKNTKPGTTTDKQITGTNADLTKKKEEAEKRIRPKKEEPKQDKVSKQLVKNAANAVKVIRPNAPGSEAITGGARQQQSSMLSSFTTWLGNAFQSAKDFFTRNVTGNYTPSGNIRDDFKDIMDRAIALGDPYPEITAAQWAWESGYGSRMPAGSNNPFGQHAVESQPHVVARDNGTGQMQMYVKYNSIDDAIAAHVKKWNKNIPEGLTPQQAIEALVKNGYNPNPAYASSILSVLSSNNINVNEINAGRNLINSGLITASGFTNMTGGKVSGSNITSGYGFRMLNGSWEKHLGVDVSVPTGTPLYAASDGIIEYAKVSPGGDGHGGQGLAVQIKAGEGLYFTYGHLSKLNVQKEQAVKKGDLIGLSGGDTGDARDGKSTGAHLHFEIRKGGGGWGTQIDPLEFLKRNKWIVAGNPDLTNSEPIWLKTLMAPLLQPNKKPNIPNMPYNPGGGIVSADPNARAQALAQRPKTPPAPKKKSSWEPNWFMKYVMGVDGLH